MIINYNAYLILALFGHDGHCITIANISLLNINNNNSHKHHHYSSYSNITQYYSNFLSFELDLIIWRGSNHITVLIETAAC